MINFRIEIDTRDLSADTEDFLMAELENVIKPYDWWNEFYQGEIHVDALQLPTCIDDESPYGQVNVYGETTEEKLEEIYYNIIDKYNVTYIDNDPLGIRRDKKILQLMKACVEKHSEVTTQ